jgi:acyl-CoA synthetase (NDP forming)
MDAAQAFKTMIRPGSVAVVGASADPASPGGAMFARLARLKVPVWPVNPRGGRVGGTRCFESLDELPAVPELAVIATRADRVAPVLDRCGRAGVKVALSIAGGFGEVGGEGRELERELAGIVARTGIRLLGPNTLGVVAPHTGLDTVFVRHEPSVFGNPGEISMVTQSGSVGVEALGMLGGTGVGIRTFLGLGNQVDLDVTDALTFLCEDEGTRVVALYLESIPDGRTLMDAVRRLTRSGRPVVILKVGRTERGSRAARSHTGRLAGSAAVTRAALLQAGAVLVGDDEELLDVSRALAFCPPSEGRSVAVVSAAGGYAVLGTDLVLESPVRARMGMADLSARTRAALARAVPSYGSVENPIDMTGVAHDEMYERVVDVLVEAPEVDALLCFLSWGPHGLSERTVDTLARAAHGDKPVVVNAMGGPETDRLVAELTVRRVAAFPSMGRAVAALGGVAAWGRILPRRP